jgi:uncharacterized protein YecT (DUF1311 family)
MRFSIGVAMLRTVVGVIAACALAGAADAGPQADPCKTRANQLELTQCADRQSAKGDALLNQTHRKLLADLDEQHRGLLQKAQRAWVAFRDADCALDASAVLGGSLYPMQVAECRAAMADARIKELQALRKSLADFLR